MGENSFAEQTKFYHYCLYSTYDVPSEERVIKPIPLVHSKTSKISSNRWAIDSKLSINRGWQPIAATHDFALILERSSKGKNTSYRLKAVGRDDQIDLFYFDHLTEAFCAFLESVRKYEDINNYSVPILATQQIETLLKT